MNRYYLGYKIQAFAFWLLNIANRLLKIDFLWDSEEMLKTAYREGFTDSRTMKHDLWRAYLEANLKEALYVSVEEAWANSELKEFTASLITMSSKRIGKSIGELCDILEAPKDQEVVLFQCVDGHIVDVDVGIWDLIQEANCEGESAYYGWFSNRGLIEPTHFARVIVDQ